MKEFLDIVDEYGVPTGEVVERSVAHAEGVMHRTSHVWLLRTKADRVQVLLQKRAEGKTFPGCYDISSAGHIPAGVDYVPSALRELQEELGVTAQEQDLICIGDLYQKWDDEFFGKPFHDRQYSRVFCMWLDQNEDQFTLQEEEVEDVMWMDLSDCVRGAESQTFPNCLVPEELAMLEKYVEKL